MKKTLRYNSPESDYDMYVVKHFIIRFSKSSDGELTYIHLTNGEVLAALDSIHTLDERLNSER